MAEWKNLVSMFYSQADRMGEKPFIWSKVDGSYKSLSWKEAAYQITTLSSSLKNLGIQSGDRVFLCAESRPEWIISNIVFFCSEEINNCLTNIIYIVASNLIA